MRETLFIGSAEVAVKQGWPRVLGGWIAGCGWVPRRG